MAAPNHLCKRCQVMWYDATPCWYCGMGGVGTLWWGGLPGYNGVNVRETTCWASTGPSHCGAPVPPFVEDDLGLCATHIRTICQRGEYPVSG